MSIPKSPARRSNPSPGSETVERGDVEAALSVEPVNEEVEEFDYFADRLLSGRGPEPDGRHGLVDMRTIEAIYELAETGERVRVED